MKYNNDIELKILKSCKDYYSLSNSLSETCLKDIETRLEHYNKYLDNHSDINAYKDEYGNESIVDWYEGLMDTKDFIDQFKDNRLFNFNDISECVNILESFVNEVNKLKIDTKEKCGYILKKYDGFIDMFDEDDEYYTIDLYQDFNNNTILATINVDKNSGEVKLSNSYDLFNCENDLFLSNYTIEDINKNKEKSKTLLKQEHNLKKAYFSCDDENIYEGYYFDDVSWNGWKVPYFTKDVADEIAKNLQEEFYELKYDSSKREYILIDKTCIENPSQDPKEYSEIYSMDTLIHEGNEVQVYAIGGFYFAWDLCNGKDILNENLEANKESGVEL